MSTSEMNHVKPPQTTSNDVKQRQTTVAIIPARYASTRFPGKPLADLGGKPMIQRTWERVQQASTIDRVLIATDDERIATAARAFGAEVALTRADHVSGTDRIAEVVRSAQLQLRATVVVNVQGDEPFIRPEQIDAVVRPILEGQATIATLCRRIDDADALFDPNVVKLTRDMAGNALYFSRHPIPFLRDVPPAEWLAKNTHFQHLGLYAFRTDVLLELTELPPAPLERLEALEQLRWLSAGHRIACVETPHATIGIDTPEDLARWRAHFAE